MNIQDKLALNCTEAMQYLNVRRRTFETEFLPLLTPIRLGTSTVRDHRSERRLGPGQAAPEHHENRNRFAGFDAQ